MGASQSKNVANVTLKAVTDEATNIMAKSKTSVNQNQGIVITGGKGGVTVGDIKQRTTATVNTKNLMKALATSNAQNSISQNLSQTAKSITSGINFGAYSNAENDMNAFLKSSIDIATNIGNTCEGQVASQQTIVIHGGEGGVKTGNIDQESVANIFQSCVTNAVSNANGTQQITQAVTQSATAKSEGLSAWGIAAIIGMVVLALTLPIIVGGNEIINGVLKLFFPIMIVGGLVMIFLYFTWTTPTTIMTTYSMGLDKSTDCSPSGATTTTKYPTFTAAHADFKKNNSYVAMDWIGYGPTKDGQRGPALKPPKTVFYTGIANPKCKVPQDPNLKFFAPPQYLQGKGKPSPSSGTEGDYYLDISTGTPYIKSKQVWYANGIQGISLDPIDTKGQSVTFNASIPTHSLKNGQYYVDTTSSKSLTLYQGSSTGPKVIKSNIAGPGFKVTRKPGMNASNTSAIKINGDKPYLLWIGGATVAMGFIGFVLTTVFAPKKAAKSTTKKPAVKATKN